MNTLDEGPRSVRQCLRRAVLTGSVGNDTVATTERFLEAHGVSVDTVDTSEEDPFVDVGRLLPDIDLSGADAVITVGSASATALAIALLCDLPFTMVGVLDGRRLAAIDDALGTGSVMHRSALDVHVDGVRRLCLSDLEIASSESIAARVCDIAGERTVEGTQLRIGSERPHSGRLCVDHAAAPAFSAEAVHIDAAPTGTRVAVNAREQQFSRLSVVVHGRPLCELVLGGPSVTAGEAPGEPVV